MNEFVPQKRDHPKRTFHLNQPPIFSGDMLVFKGVAVSFSGVMMIQNTIRYIGLAYMVYAYLHENPYKSTIHGSVNIPIVPCIPFWCVKPLDFDEPMSPGFFWIWFYLSWNLAGIIWVCPPAQDAIVTTRIIIFLVGDPNLNLHLPLESWEGLSQPKV